MVNTRRMEDVQWLDELIKNEPLYRKVATEDLKDHYDNIWNQHATDNDTIYVKIDDDIVRSSLHSIQQQWMIDRIVGIHPRRRHPPHGSYTARSPRSSQHRCKHSQLPADTLASLSH